MERVLNDKHLSSLQNQAKKWPRDKPRTLLDSVAPGGAVRIYGGTGAISLGMIARFPLHPKNPTFRKIANYSGPECLRPWRNTVRAWRVLLDRGIDPRIEAARERAQAARAQANTFAAVWAAFSEDYIAKLRRGKRAEIKWHARDRYTKRVERWGRDFLRLWANRVAQEIEPREIADYFRARAKTTPGEAHMGFSILGRCFSWTLGNGGYGLTHNPCRSLSPSDIIGPKLPRTRTLSDNELRAVWAACDGPPGLEGLRATRPGYRGAAVWAFGWQWTSINSFCSYYWKLSGNRAQAYRVALKKTGKSLEDIAGGDIAKLTGLGPDYRWPEKIEKTKAPSSLPVNPRHARGGPKANRLGYPWGPVIRFMLLTGQREDECAGMTWSEVDFHQKLWTIPEERMKKVCGVARAHAVPLAPDALALLRSLPRFESGPHVFSCTDGLKPVSGFGPIKVKLDRASGVSNWVFHDLRRTMRTHLGAFPQIQHHVRELMISHQQRGMARIYDLFEYLTERRQGFELWEERLRSILQPEPPPAKVADLATARRKRAA